TAMTAQNETTVTFGLGEEKTIDFITVFWPSGIVQNVAPPSVDRRILVEESAVTGTVATIPRPDALRLSAARPNPFRAETVVTYELPVAARVTLRVYDVAGRRVRDLERGPRPAGTHHVTWNGTDARNRSVAPGIYFLRLQAGERTLVRRVVRLR
ncbi:MAG TPA: FlgD immunoglobulin-like domain containing protein, partial [bacterium]|nr:FlgD immunoglobulin-like domain containing protein [bacterium]